MGVTAKVAVNHVIGTLQNFNKAFLFVVVFIINQVAQRPIYGAKIP